MRGEIPLEHTLLLCQHLLPSIGVVLVADD